MNGTAVAAHNDSLPNRVSNLSNDRYSSLNSTLLSRARIKHRLEMQDPICIFEPGKVCPNAIDDLRNLLRSVFQRKVVMISIAGRFRQGKSFIMNFVIK